MRGSGEAPQGRAAGADVAGELAGGVAAAPQASVARAAALAGGARGERNGACPVRGAAVAAGEAQAVREASVRVARIVSAPVRLQLAGARYRGGRREARRRAGSA